ncbi:hypothetical protein HAX54_044865 [Datura stramonium]|uniref:Importin subunit alpha n=1 Tax=Datura stramonium TaxID=4076 RepID=A0ABS8RP98_DATST|nr:hypothetical protein [Datura stramonium]
MKPVEGEDNLVEIRKNKREDNLLKKRREIFFSPSNYPMLLKPLPLLRKGWHIYEIKDDVFILCFPNLFYYNLGPLLISFCVFWAESIPVMVQGVWSEDPAPKSKQLHISGSSVDCCLGVDKCCTEHQNSTGWLMINELFLCLYNLALPVRHVQASDRALCCNPVGILALLVIEVKPALPVLQQLIHMNDEEVLTDACWALSYLSDGPNDKIQAVIDAGVCPRLVELLLHPSPTVSYLSFSGLRNIVTGDDAQTQYVIDNQVLPCLYQLLTQNHKKSIKKEACWTISNITAGNRAQIQMLDINAIFAFRQAVIEANIILPLVHLLQNAEFDIKKRHGLSQMLHLEDLMSRLGLPLSLGAKLPADFSSYLINDDPALLEDELFLASQGCIKPLCDLLICPDPRIVTVCLRLFAEYTEGGERWTKAVSATVESICLFTRGSTNLDYVLIFCRQGSGFWSGTKAF